MGLGESCPQIEKSVFAVTAIGSLHSLDNPTQKKYLFYSTENILNLYPETGSGLSRENVFITALFSVIHGKNFATSVKMAYCIESHSNC